MNDNETLDEIEREKFERGIEFIPTPEQIRAATEKVQETWDDRDRQKRSGGMESTPVTMEPISENYLTGRNLGSI